MTPFRLFAQLNPDQLFFLAAIVIVLFIVFGMFLLISGSLLRYWLQAFLSGTPIPMVQLLGMRFRRVAASKVIPAGIMAAQAGARLSWPEIESAYLQGADLEKVIPAFIEATKQNMNLTFDEIVQAERNERLQTLLKL